MALDTSMHHLIIGPSRKRKWIDQSIEENIILIY